MSQHFAHSACALRLVSLFLFDHSGRKRRRVRLHRANPYNPKSRQDPQFENQADATLLQKDEAILSRVAVHRHWQHVCLRASAIGQTVDDVKWRRRILPRQTAEQRNDSYVRDLHMRKPVYASRKRAAIAEADQSMISGIKRPSQIAGARDPQRGKRHRIFAEVGRNLTKLKTVTRGDMLLESHARGDLAVYAHMNNTEPVGSGNQPMGFDISGPEPGRDLALGEACAIVQPRRANAQVVV